MISVRIRNFLISGGFGFIVDSGILLLMSELWLFSPFISRSASLPASIITTWLFNRHLTFKDRNSDNILKEFSKYLASSSFGLMINIGTYLFLVNFVDFFYEYPLIALAIGVGISMVFNFLSYYHFVFNNNNKN